MGPNSLVNVARRSSEPACLFVLGALCDRFEFDR